MNNYPPRLLPASHAGLPSSDWIICPLISSGDTDRNCLGTKCAAWTPTAIPGYGLCKIIERRSAAL